MQTPWRRLSLWIALFLLVCAAFLALPVAAEPPVLPLSPRGSTGTVPGDADDCAIWVSPDDPSRAVVIGTDKSSKSNPGLHVWDLMGKELQFVPVPRPNNVDVRRNVQLGEKRVDLAVCNARGTQDLRVFRIDRATGTLEDITSAQGIPTPELEDPYGICLYVRPRDGALFVIASTQTGKKDRLHQWRLTDDGTGRVGGRYVRAIGPGTIEGYVEGLVADDELGWVYASDEDFAVRKYAADPDAGDAQVTAFALDDSIRGDREGLAIYDCGGGTGWLVLSSQGDHTVKVYRREGEAGNPHQQPLVATLATRGSRSTDGLDITSQALPGFPAGLLAKHHSKGRNFALYSWAEVQAQLPCARSRAER